VKICIEWGSKIKTWGMMSRKGGVFASALPLPAAWEMNAPTPSKSDILLISHANTPPLQSGLVKTNRSYPKLRWIRNSAGLLLHLSVPIGVIRGKKIHQGHMKSSTAETCQQRNINAF
jgi:hypothetical protein